MGATRIGVIAEGPIDHVLVAVLLERIARDRAHFTWPVLPDDAAQGFPVRKRGHGGVLDAVRRITAVLSQSSLYADYSFFIVLVDRRTKAVQKEVRKLVSGTGRFIMGVAIEEIEAWWLGDRGSTLDWCGLGNRLPGSARYAQKGYVAEKDRAPKKTLDELTDLSPELDRRYGEGNAGLAMEFADIWKGTAKLADIETQCPRGFGKFCRVATNALRSAKTSSGR